jgi:hypothetical protein
MALVICLTRRLGRVKYRRPATTLVRGAILRHDDLLETVNPTKGNLQAMAISVHAKGLW